LTFQYFLKERREQLNLSRNDLAIKIGVTPSAIANYENEISSPKIELMYKLFEALKCDANYLHQDDIHTLIYQNEATPEEFEKIVKKYRDLDPHGKEMVDFTLQKEWERSKAQEEEKEKLQKQSQYIKELEDSARQTAPQEPHTRIINYYYRLASAGTGQIVFDMPPTKRIEIPDIPEYRSVDYAIGVNGSSMEPEYSDGDTLLIEMAEEVMPGENGIFLVDGESYVKKLGDGELISLNPEYGNIPLTENSRCMGKVVGKL